MRKIPKHQLYPNEFESFRGWWIRQWRTLCNFIHHSIHHGVIPPFTLKKYFHVMGVTHRCMKAWRQNHRLLRKNFGKADVAAFGYQSWQEKKPSDPNYDPNWEIKFSDDGKVPVTEADGSDDRADSDPPKRR